MPNRTLVVLGLVFIASGLALGAPGLVQNSDFQIVVDADKSWPASWQAETACRALYHWVDDDGFSANSSLQYSARTAGPAGPVTQAVACKPNTEYVLSAAFKSDGKCVPLVQVFAPGPQQVAVALAGSAGKVWKTAGARFNSGNVDKLEVRIYGDQAIVKSGQAAVGSSGVDDVQIYLAADAPAEVRPADVFVPPGPNIARGKPYALAPGPGYGYCTDRGDRTDLTDGVYTVGYFWTQKSTVGWGGAMPVIISLDLGKVEPIAGLSYSTAAGVAGVTWPSSIFILVSNDAKSWYYAGDLIREATRQGGPRPDGYSTYRFTVGDLKTAGRYVKLFVAQVPYAFVDEIEVYRGPEALLTQASPGQPVEDAETFFVSRRAVSGVLWRLRTDLADARAAIVGSALGRAEKASLAATADKLATEIDATPEQLPRDFRTVLPFSDLHARIYSLNAPVLRSRGLAPLTVWTQNRWDPLLPTQAPARPGRVRPALKVQMMRREYRAEVLNLTNATDRQMTAMVNVSGLPGGANPDYVSVREVLFTDTPDRKPIAAALPPARKTRGGYRLAIPAGTTRQVWFSFRPLDVPPGTYRGEVTVTASRGGEAAVPLTLQVYPFDFPDLPSIAIGGWDYTETTGAYDAGKTNLPALIANLREHFVDTPWAGGSVAPWNAQFDRAGKLTNRDKLDFSRWDGWLQKWPAARHYAVFLSVGNTLAGEKIGTARFSRMVGEWITAWVEHIKGQGVTPNQLILLIIDEPTKPEQDEIITAWAKALRAAQPQVVIWEDVCHADPQAVSPDLYANCTVLCPNTPRFLSAAQSYRDFFAAQKAAGRELWFYSCNGGKNFDPTSYWRGQFWWAIKYGARGSCFWAFSDEGGAGTSWNAYVAPRTGYVPLFLSPTGVTDGKHMEALREGAEDYEYFVRLSARVAELEAKGVKSPLLTRAKGLLTSGPDRVVSQITGERLTWTVPKDRAVMDQVRIEALEALSELSKL